MNKKISLGAAITFMIVVAGVTFCITMMVALNHFNDMVLNVKEREEMYKKISNIDAEVRQNYTGASQIDEEYLSDMISAGYIRGIGDKYASYLTKDEYETVLQEQNGQLVSIGVTLAKDQTGYLKVLSVQEGSPADQNGIKRGDLLISADGTDLKNLTLSRGEQLAAAGRRSWNHCIRGRHHAAERNVRCIFCGSADVGACRCGHRMRGGVFRPDAS